VALSQRRCGAPRWSGGQHHREKRPCLGRTMGHRRDDRHARSLLRTAFAPPPWWDERMR